jgi:hypothetical protein
MRPISVPRIRSLRHLAEGILSHIGRKSAGLEVRGGQARRRELVLALSQGTVRLASAHSACPFWLPASHCANWARYRHARRHCSHPWPRMRRGPSRRVAREMPTAHSSYITTAGRRISVRCLRVRAQVRHSLERTPMRFRIARIKDPQPCARRPARAQGQH